MGKSKNSILCFILQFLQLFPRACKMRGFTSANRISTSTRTTVTSRGIKQCLQKNQNRVPRRNSSKLKLLQQQTDGRVEVSNEHLDCREKWSRLVFPTTYFVVVAVSIKFWMSFVYFCLSYRHLYRFKHADRS